MKEFYYLKADSASNWNS